MAITPPYPIDYDAAQGIVYITQNGGEPAAVPAGQYFGQYNVILLQLAFLVLVVAALMAGVLAVGVWAQLSLKRFLPFLLGASWFFVLGVLVWPAYIDQGLPLFEVLGITVTLDGIL